MKAFFYLLFLPLFISIVNPSFLMSQHNLDFDILFASYSNNHLKKEFHSEERRWVLKNDSLIYDIDIRNKRYSDTIVLDSRKIQIIVEFVESKNLNKSATQDIRSPYLSKMGQYSLIKGWIKQDKKLVEYNIKYSSSVAVNNDVQTEDLLKFQDLLYQLFEKK
jgi:hypothetical protein